jgi:hypothetical protein
MGTQRMAWAAEGRGGVFLSPAVPPAAAPCPVLLPLLAVASPGVNRTPYAWKDSECGWLLLVVWLQAREVPMSVLALARNAGEIGPRAGRAMVECCVVI